MTTKSKSLIVIAGPTGSGKTDLSITVAQHFGVPILSADSRQVFKGMPIGTAQPTPDQLAQVEHYLITSHEITEHYTAGRYEKEALDILENLFRSLDIVVAVGGSGLYIDALCNGMDSLPKSDPQLREELTMQFERHGLENLLQQLHELDPEYFEQVDRNNHKRVIRALEVCLQTGRPYSLQRSGTRIERSFNIIKIGTKMPREILYDRINRRVDMMMAEGLEQEARQLFPYRHLNSLRTVGYRELFEYFDGTISLDEAVALIKQNSRRYAKRQVTWFGRDEDITWFDPADHQSVISFLEQKIPSR